jgi:hypothetical protein
LRSPCRRSALCAAFGERGDRQEYREHAGLITYASPYDDGPTGQVLMSRVGLTSTNTLPT